VLEKTGHPVQKWHAVAVLLIFLDDVSVEEF